MTLPEREQEATNRACSCLSRRRLSIMRKNTRKTEPPQFLSGWKSIASCLGMGVRTVQRYEHLFGLPVRRHPGMLRGPVVASKPELDAWAGVHLAAPEMEHPPSMVGLQDGAAEVQRLCNEIIALRSEMKKSVRLITESTHRLRPWRGAGPTARLRKPGGRVLI